MDWNRLLVVNRFLMIDEFDGDDGTTLRQQFSDDWSLELGVQADTGQLMAAELRAFMNTHTDQLIMRFVSMLTLHPGLEPEAGVRMG